MSTEWLGVLVCVSRGMVDITEVFGTSCKETFVEHTA